MLFVLQGAIVVEIPPYRNQRISNPVHVNFYVCNGKRKRSQYQRFTYLPPNGNHPLDFLHLYLPVTLKELYISHSALIIKSISPVLDQHQLKFTVAVKKLILKIASLPFFLEVLVNAPGPAWARSVSEGKKCGDLFIL